MLTKAVKIKLHIIWYIDVRRFFSYLRLKENFWHEKQLFYKNIYDSNLNDYEHFSHYWELMMSIYIYIYIRICHISRDCMSCISFRVVWTPQGHPTHLKTNPKPNIPPNSTIIHLLANFQKCCIKYYIIIIYNWKIFRSKIETSSFENNVYFTKWNIYINFETFVTFRRKNLEIYIYI